MLASILAMTSLGAPIYSELVRVPHEAVSLNKPIEITGVRPAIDWNEAILSWNISNANSARLKVEVSFGSKWLNLADWHGNLSKGNRASFPDQADGDVRIDVDTIKSKSFRATIDLRLTLEQVESGPEPKVKLLTVCFSNASNQATMDVLSGFEKLLDPPQRAQAPHESGKLKYRPEVVSSTFESWLKKVKGAQYCSPTSVSMLLGYWAKKLGRPELDQSVPEVVASVFDEKYPGTGNWSFNVALMGSQSGLTSYVTRLAKIGDLEALLAAENPVICSVSNNLLQANGKPPGNDGHLVVLVGMNKAGDLIINDPGNERQIRRSVKRTDFWNAWSHSGRTVYVCHPYGTILPKLTDRSVLDQR